MCMSMLHVNFATLTCNIDMQHLTCNTALPFQWGEGRPNLLICYENWVGKMTRGGGENEHGCLSLKPPTLDIPTGPSPTHTAHSTRLPTEKRCITPAAPVSTKKKRGGIGKKCMKALEYTHEIQYTPSLLYAPTPLNFSWVIPISLPLRHSAISAGLPFQLPTWK